MKSSRTLRLLIIANVIVLCAQLLWVWFLGRDILLLLGCATGDSGLTSIALALGANPNTRAPDGTTALMLAARSSAPIVSDILRRGADPNATTPEGYTALIYAVRAGDPFSVRLLLKSGANPNYVEPFFKTTPLMWAVRDWRFDMVKSLLSYGADPSLRSLDGRTAISILQEYKDDHEKMLKLLQAKMQSKHEGS